jgi:hypothetical protein
MVPSRRIVGGAWRSTIGVSWRETRAIDDDKPAACSPGLDAKVAAAMDVTERYLGTMADIFGDVDTADCETLRRELVALTPVADEWTTKLTALKTEPMSDECKASFDERFAARGQAIQSSYGRKERAAAALWRASRNAGGLPERSSREEEEEEEEGDEGLTYFAQLVGNTFCLNWPSQFPGRSYWQTQMSLPLHWTMPQPICVVSVHTTCVKWPVSIVKPVGFLKS